MAGRVPDIRFQDDIAASWERCARQHRLARDSARPIMRLQTSEIAPRLEQIVERTGGRQGFFRQIATVVRDGGRCLVITDADGVLVRLEAAEDGDGARDWNGIALGSCWDERIAGTNGVSMALRTKRVFTISGADHFYSGLRSFACTGAPIFDAEGAVVGTVNLVAFDHDKRTDHLFARQFLETATHRIQRRLFEQRFADQMLVSVSPDGPGGLLSGDGLIAVDEAGIILGATQAAGKLLGGDAPCDLTGQPFEVVFDMESRALAKAPDRVLSMPMPRGPAVTLSARLPGAVRPARPAAASPGHPVRRRRLPPSLRQLATGSKTMAAACAQAEMIYAMGTPFLIEGETGAGKSALVAALAGQDPIIKVDCASMVGAQADVEALRAALSQARVFAMAPGAGRARPTVAFDNVDEMPARVQAELRGLMEDLEADRPLCAADGRGHPRIVSLSRRSLGRAVAEGRFRDDLFYMIGAARVGLPPLRDREQPEVLARVLATRIADRPIAFSDEAAALIRAHPFPGNVRELQGALERALMTASGGRITPVDLLATSIAGAGAAPAPTAPAPRLTYDERTLIQDALASCGWNVSEAARRLNMGRATINRKIRRHGLIRPA